MIHHVPAIDRFWEILRFRVWSPRKIRVGRDTRGTFGPNREESMCSIEFEMTENSLGWAHMPCGSFQKPLLAFLKKPEIFGLFYPEKFGFWRRLVHHNANSPSLRQMVLIKLLHFPPFGKILHTLCILSRMWRPMMMLCYMIFSLLPLKKWK